MRQSFSILRLEDLKFENERSYTNIVYYLWDSIVKGLTDDVYHVLVKITRLTFSNKSKCNLLKMRRNSTDNKTAELSLNSPSCKKQQLMIYVPGKRPRHNSLDTYFAGVYNMQCF